jgi:hypothetical protein
MFVRAVPLGALRALFDIDHHWRFLDAILNSETLFMPMEE